MNKTQLQHSAKDFRGLNMIRALRALNNAKNKPGEALAALPKNDPMVSQFLQKALVGGTGTDSALQQQNDPIALEFGQYVFERTLPGQILAEGGITLDFNTRLDGITASGAAWTPEGAAFPVVQGTTASGTLKDYKIGAVTVLSNDLLRQTSQGTDLAIRNALVTNSVREIDQKFVSDDPQTDGTSPAGILNGAQLSPGPVPQLVYDHIKNNNDPRTSALILPFNDPDGGAATYWLTEAQIQTLALMGIAVHYNQYTKNPFMVDAAKLVIGYIGGVIDTTTAASIEMETAPVNDSLEPLHTQMINLFQDNATAYKVVTYIDWAVMDNGVTAM